jgi:deazaflavin-dependent oxidoreductase (nitroreductase family)
LRALRFLLFEQKKYRTGNMVMAQPQQQQRWWHPTVKRLIAQRPVVWILSRTFHHVDRLVIRLSDGKHTATTFMTGLPIVTLTTTGAKSGKLRSVPLVAFPDGDKLVFVASNWGQEAHPGWYHNMRANPQVEISHNGQSKQYRAHEAIGSERERYWRQAVDSHPGYATYKEHAKGRTIPIMICTPADNPPKDKPGDR